jgi:hypothetical protein
MPEALFTIARFLLHETKLRRPKGVQLLYPFHSYNIDSYLLKRVEDLFLMLA